MFLRALFLLMILVVYFAWKAWLTDMPTKVRLIQNGDTIVLASGKTINLLGINTTERGSESSQMSKRYLESLLDGRNIWLEYGGGKTANFAWVWVGCERTPKLLISEILGLKENPIGCKKGVLANEQIIKMGWSKTYFLSNNEGVKYGERLNALEK